ncbi:hypothetical protein BO71DRAFT_196704 [Aspergillus ellipticus CBS 707.79]|uniref:Uncharacterized protein n=1 Tax=Aspergillus ellipticus CBS 707.79 TaxID=1448320 RepID=A0A319DEX6_9EURO|nr:hypothetical protein BO71DRAFT_196704 [Aspergillus ellipticus CBS 707.79]
MLCWDTLRVIFPPSFSPPLPTCKREGSSQLTRSISRVRVTIMSHPRSLSYLVQVHSAFNSIFFFFSSTWLGLIVSPGRKAGACQTRETDWMRFDFN